MISFKIRNHCPTLKIKSLLFHGTSFQHLFSVNVIYVTQLFLQYPIADATENLKINTYN